MNAQPPATLSNDPEHWPQRAIRKIADLMGDIPSREAMLRMAAEYEGLAKQAEERCNGRD
jgi:hypothetical protein